MKIPDKGLSREEVFKRLEEYKSDDIDWKSGRVFGYIFDPGREAMDVGKDAFSLFLTESALDFSVFPSLLRLENELVEYSSHHLSGDENVVGNFTSGGTESIMLAVKAARDYCREKKPHIKEPEMIIPSTAHAAFFKAAHYLCVKVVQVPVDPETFRAVPELVEKAVNGNTILIVGSAPSYAHGVVDPIPEMAAIAMKNNILFHTDACMGGFLLPYFKRLGREMPDFDFTVPGVTSISMDLHKYAYAPKGASIILYKSKDIRKHQIFACSHWTGYTIINNSVQSTKSGGPMAAAWAVLNFIGDEGYREIARRKIEATDKVVEGIKRIKELRLLGSPDMCLVAFTSDSLNVFQIIDEMNSRGWYIQPALAYGNSKENIHISINYSNVDWMDKLLEDLGECVEKVKEAGPGGLPDDVKKNLSDLDLSRLTDEEFRGLLEMAGIRDGGLPEKMAGINDILNSIPPSSREKILIEYVNNLFRYRDK